jgi:heat shock protein HtpX
MIAALQRLASGHAESTLPQQVTAFGIIGGGAKKLFMTHPPIEERIAALQAAA